MGNSIELSGVEETLMIPLWARANSTRQRGLIHDPAAVDLAGRLDYDFKSKLNHARAVAAFMIVRAKRFDEKVRDFIDRHPRRRRRRDRLRIGYAVGAVRRLPGRLVRPRPGPGDRAAPALLPGRCSPKDDCRFPAGHRLARAGGSADTSVPVRRRGGVAVPAATRTTQTIHL